MAEAAGASELDTFIHRKLIPGFKEARRLRAVVDVKTEPYKSKYASADLLASLEEQAAQYLTQNAIATDNVHHCIAACRLERGLALIETDLTADGQKALEQGLEHNWPSTSANHAILQQGHNALGGLWCNREEFDKSLQYLHSAVEHYKEIKADSCSSGDQSTSVRPPGLQDADAALAQDQTRASSILGGVFPAVAEQVEQQYTTTLYYLAQVYGFIGDKMQSASYCAATLNRQLRQGALDVNEWVQHCLQLSGYFLDGNVFALSSYCCSAVELMLLQRQHRQQHQAKQENLTAPEATITDQHQQQQQQTGDDSCAGCKHHTASRTEHVDGSATGINSSSCGTGTLQLDSQDKQKVSGQRHVSIAKAEQQALSSQYQSASSLLRLRPLLQDLDADVAANVRLAFAKLHLYRLVASHAHFVEGKQLHFSCSTPEGVSDALYFNELPGLPELSSLKWGYDALAHNHQDALQLFRQALPWFKEALQYYQLEGWVTEHCHILFEMSNLYRCLAGFESDPHKRCVMHRNRAKLLQGLEGQLSPAHYPGLARSISLELGNIYREIGDIKAAAGREPEKVAAAWLSAAHHYRLFLESFKGPDGKMPAKVEQEMEHHYISAAFCLARVLQASSGSKKDPRAQVAALEQAALWLDTIVEYVGGNEVASHQEEAQLALEMSGLLKEKLTLMRRMQNQMVAKE